MSCSTLPYYRFTGLYACGLCLRSYIAQKRGFSTLFFIAMVTHVTGRDVQVTRKLNCNIYNVAYFHIYLHRNGEENHSHSQKALVHGMGATLTFSRALFECFRTFCQPNHANVMWLQNG